MKKAQQTAKRFLHEPIHSIDLIYCLILHLIYFNQYVFFFPISELLVLAVPGIEVFQVHKQYTRNIHGYLTLSVGGDSKGEQHLQIVYYFIQSPNSRDEEGGQLFVKLLLFQSHSLVYPTTPGF